MEHYYCEICKGCIHSTLDTIEEKGYFYHSYCLEEEIAGFERYEMESDEVKLGYIS